MDDLNNIRDVVSRWDRQWLHRASEIAISKEWAELGSQEAQGLWHPSDYLKEVFQIQSVSGAKFYARPTAWWSLGPGPESWRTIDVTPGRYDPWSDSLESAPRPNNLREFNLVWDALSRVTVYYLLEVGSQAVVVSPTQREPRDVATVETAEIGASDDRVHRLELVHIGTTIEKQYGPGLRDELERLFRKTWVDRDDQSVRPQHGFALQSEWEADTPYVVFVPVTVESFEFDGRRAFNELFGVKFHAQSFESTFNDLYRITKRYMHMSFDDIALILESEKERQPESFEFLGARVPAASLMMFGIPAVLAVQLYLLVHLWHAAGQSETCVTRPVPWLGIYLSRSARAITAVSVTLLPVLTVATLSLYGSGRAVWALKWAVLVASAGLSACLGVCGWHEIARLRQQCSTLRFAKRRSEEEV